MLVNSHPFPLNFPPLVEVSERSTFDGDIWGFSFINLIASRRVHTRLMLGEQVTAMTLAWSINSRTRIFMILDIKNSAK
jgi:hypothetical protein